MKRLFPLLFTIAVAALALFGVFWEGFSDAEPTSYAAYQDVSADKPCTYTVEVSGEVWLACPIICQPITDSFPVGVPNVYPPYQGVVPQRGPIKPQRLQIDCDRKLTDEEILMRVRNPYGKYCRISEWVAYNIKVVKRPWWSKKETISPTNTKQR